MATIQGNGGGFTSVTGFDAKWSSWSAEFEIESVDTTGFDDGGFRAKAGAIISMTGSAEGTLTFDASSTAPILDALADGSALAVGDLDSAIGTITLTAQTGCTLACSALITSISISRPNDGKADITMNWESTGPITQTWDETP